MLWGGLGFGTLGRWVFGFGTLGLLRLRVLGSHVGFGDKRMRRFRFEVLGIFVELFGAQTLDPESISRATSTSKSYCKLKTPKL